MGTTLFIAAIVGIIIVAAYALAKMDDRYQKEKAIAGEYRQRMLKAENEVIWLNSQIKCYQKDIKKAELRVNDLQKNYDKLLNDYHTLEEETRKSWEESQEK